MEETAAAEKPAAEKPKSTVTPASVWRAKATQVFHIELPSGATVKVNRPKWAKLLASGALSADDVMSANGKSTVDQITQILPTAKRVVANIVAEPRVFMQLPEDGVLPEDAILVDEIPEDDVIALFGWAATVAAPKIVANEALQ